MLSLSFGLRFKNFLRWLAHHIVSWGILAVIYGLTLSVLLEPLLDHFLPGRFGTYEIFGLVFLFLLFIFIVESVRVGSYLGYGWSKIITKLGFLSHFAKLYCFHQSRKLSVHFILLLIGSKGSLPDYIG